MRLILNEKQLLDDSLNKGYIDREKPINTVRILAKHYLGSGMRKSQTYDNIDGFFKKYYKGYNTVSWYKSINRAINKISRDKDFTFIDIKSVNISKSEIEKINLIGNQRLEKLAFVLLVYAKIFNQLNNTDKNWVNEEHKYIFSDAKIAVTKEDQGKMIHKLKELGLVDVSVMVDSTNVKVNFTDDGETAIEITDFRNYVYEYLEYFGGNIGRCDCNNLFRITGKNHKMCNECWKEKEKELKREWWNKNH